MYQLSTVEQKKQLYLQRVNQLYNQIKHWLSDDTLQVVEGPPVTLQESELGTYSAKVLAIETPEGDVAIQFKPRGANIVMAEGLIELESWLGKEYLVYMRTGGPTLTTPTGVERPIYQGIDTEGWYWIEDSRRIKAHLLNKTLLLELITMVSDYVV